MAASSGRPRRTASRGSPARCRAKAATCSGPASTIRWARPSWSTSTSPCRRRWWRPAPASPWAWMKPTAGAPGTGAPRTRAPTASPSMSARTSCCRKTTTAASATPSRCASGTCRKAKRKAKELMKEFALMLDFFESHHRPLPVRRRKNGRGRNAAQGHGTPDHQRLRQRVREDHVRLRRPAAARIRPRIFRQPGDQRQLGRHVAARRPGQLHAAAVHAIPARRPGIFCRP